MSENKRYISYYIAQGSTAGFLNQQYHSKAKQLTNPSFDPLPDVLQTQKHAVEQYVLEERREHTEGTLIAQFVEHVEHKKNMKWPILSQAILACQQNNAKLIIAEIGTLTNSKEFTQSILESDIQFHCVDQPFIDHKILFALSKHAQVQRKLHGKLIREGLKQTSAKSGNPNAAEVISKVNKPKIDTAILFALLLQPIISDYRKKGFSQRQMVKTLNEEGFTAPEGGRWVLSQLQKVLDRVKLNEIALQTKHDIESYEKQGFSHEEIAAQLTANQVRALKRTSWNEAQVNKLVTRVNQINEITQMNSLILSLLKTTKYFKQKGQNETQILHLLHERRIPLKEKELA